MKDYVAKFGHGTAKNAKQAQSKEKTLEKMVRSGLTEKVTFFIDCIHFIISNVIIIIIIINRLKLKKLWISNFHHLVNFHHLSYNVLILLLVILVNYLSFPSF